VETFFGLVHQKLDDQPNISYVGSFFLACMVLPAQPFKHHFARSSVTRKTIPAV